MNAPIPTLDTWPEQSIRGHSIPGSRYTSREFMEQEWEGMWTRVWLLLGRESELPEPGDWRGDGRIHRGSLRRAMSANRPISLLLSA